MQRICLQITTGRLGFKPVESRVSLTSPVSNGVCEFISEMFRRDRPGDGPLVAPLPRHTSITVGLIAREHSFEVMRII